MVEPAARERLKSLYRALQDRPLWPDDPMYVELFADPALSSVDPVERMATSIEFAAIETAQLFSGHRGTGKSTQLRKLQRRLERDPTYKVVICDMEDYLPMTDEVDVVDFLLAAAGALSEALSVSELLGTDPAHSYWARFTGWLRSQKIEVSELGIAAKATSGSPADGIGIGVKLNLKTDPEFRKRVRERMKLHVGAFRAEVHAFVQDCLLRLRKLYGDDTQLVVIYDSVEHLRGTTANATAVATSVERLFRGHSDALRFPYVHTVFTVPPWLRMQYAGVDDRFDNYCQIPCVKVRERPAGPGATIVYNDAGLDALWRVAKKRGDLTWLLGDREAFDELARVSGGYLRDLFRMLMLLVNDANSYGVPVSAERRHLAVEELRSAYLGFTNQDAAWLHRIDQTGALDIDEAEHHHKLARFLDTHVLLAYRNGEDWYGIHPVIREVVVRRAKARGVATPE